MALQRTLWGKRGMAFDPNPMAAQATVDDGINAVYPNGVPPQQGQRRPGLFGRLGSALGRVDWERLGAALRDDPSILQNLMEQRQNSRLLDFRVRGMKDEEGRAAADRAARDQAMQALPENLRQVAPLLTNEAISRAVAPTPDWQIDEATGRPYTTTQNGEITWGTGNITPRPRTGTGSGTGGASYSEFGFTEQDVNDAGLVFAMSGMPVGDITGSRDRRLNGPIVAAGLQARRRLGFGPETFAAVRLAYQGDRSSIQGLQRTRDQVAANEGAARSAIQNIATLQSQLPRGQISNVPNGNDALQAYNRTLGGQGPLAAYVGAIITARAEYARVISGNNNPPVEAMHEAERVLPSNITPQALSAVTANLEREMEFRTQAFDTVLNDIQQRVGFDVSPQTPSAAPNLPWPAGSANSGNVIRYDVQGNRIQ